MGQTTKDRTPTSVYRYYDRNGLLLYVGITSRGVTRNHEHNTTKSWWPYVTRQDVEHCVSRPQAEDRERYLIRQFRPPFNKQHNPGWQELQEIYFRLGTQPGLSMKLLDSLIPKSHRLELSVEARADTAYLSTQPDGMIVVSRFDPDDLRFAKVTPGKGKVQVSTASIKDGQLQLVVKTHRRCQSASLMFGVTHQTTKFFTLKQLDLTFRETLVK